MPVYYAVYTFVSEPETYWWPLNREVPIQYAASLMWAVMVGYTLPTILMFSPWKNANTIQNFEALWQVSPMLVPLICSLLGHLYVKRHSLKQVSRRAKDTFPDIQYLQKLYVATGVLGLALHVYCIARIILSPNLSLMTVFWPDFSAENKSLGEGLRALFLADFWGFELATYAWLCMAVWDVKRMGRTTVDIAQASSAIALGVFIAGPGATMSAVWFWRENALAKTTFTKGPV
jgi:hypothetical protein